MAKLADAATMNKDKAFNILRRLYGPFKFYGPYPRKSDGRKIVCLHTNEGATTKLLAKVKLEIKLRRRLGKNDTVDHVDEDPTNDRYANLQLLSRIKNAKKSAFHVKTLPTTCAHCDKQFVPSVTQRNTKTKAGPFCSRACVGSYGASVRKTGQTKSRQRIRKRKTKGDW